MWEEATQWRKYREVKILVYVARVGSHFCFLVSGNGEGEREKTHAFLVPGRLGNCTVASSHILWPKLSRMATRS